MVSDQMPNMRGGDTVERCTPTHVRWGMCQGPPTKAHETSANGGGISKKEPHQEPEMVRGKSASPSGKRGQAKGRFFVTPHAVKKYRSEVRRQMSYGEALLELIGITSQGKYRGQYRGKFILENYPGTKIELWRGPKLCPRSKGFANSRMRFVVAHGRPGKPQVITVLPRGREQNK